MGSHALRSSAGAASSANAEPVVVAVLLPHAPILVPPVGGPRGLRAQATTQAMRQASEAVVASRPDALVLISPHMPRHHHAFGLASQVRGDLAAFDCPEAAINLPSAPALRQRVESFGSRAGLHFHDTSHAPLDHGATVPLWFLAEAGWNGPTLVLGIGQGTGNQLGALGDTLREAARDLGLRIAVVASGDMSHRLTPDAPCGHHPRAADSDAAFIRLLRAGRYDEISRMDPTLLELAAEDATETTRIAVAAAKGDTTGHRVLSYEGPFGVGYGVALLCHHPATHGLGADLLQIARMSLESAVRGIPHPPPDPKSGPLTARHGVFVTLHRDTGELRGCIGTLAPHYAHVAEETWLMAREAALSDSRFAPVEPAELDHLVIDVSVLSAPEPVDSVEDLDPARYGVIVRSPDGRCGTLLPDIPGIDSPREQVAIARRKAGIRPDEGVRLERYSIAKYTERFRP